MSLGLLGVALVCALSSFGGASTGSAKPPLRAPSPTGIVKVPNGMTDDVYADRFNDGLTYDMAGMSYTFNGVQAYNHDNPDGDAYYEYSYYPISIDWNNTGYSTYRAFMIANAQSGNAPEWDGQQEEYRFYTNSSFVYGYYTDFGGQIALTLITGTPNTSLTYDDGFYGGKFFVNNFVVSLTGNYANSESAGNTEPSNIHQVITSNDWTSYYSSYLGYTIFTTSINLYDNNNGFWGYGTDFTSLNILFANVTQNASEYFNNGYESGYNTGSHDGYNSGYQTGYDAGYSVGLQTSGSDFFSLMSAVADTPVLMLRSLFNFDLFGVNLLTVVLSLITALFIFGLIRKFIL